MIRGRDENEARRALRELVERSSSVLGGREMPDAGSPEVEAERPRRASRIRSTLLALLNDAGAPIEARLLGLQGARQLWDEGVEAEMVKKLSDPVPSIRRLAAQSLSWEPKAPRSYLVPKLIEGLGDPDDHVLREIALAIGTHGKEIPEIAAGPLLSWLLAHPSTDVTTRDAFIRGLERLGDVGVESVARLIRTANPDRPEAVAIYTAFRVPAAATRLPALATTDGLPGVLRAALVRQIKDIPLDIPVPTQPVADWVVAPPRGRARGQGRRARRLPTCRKSGPGAGPGPPG